MLTAPIMSAYADGAAAGPTSYFTLAGGLEREVQAKRSRFICRLARVDTRAQIQTELAAQRKRHQAARHHCSAFLLGPDGSERGSSDDGEPSGTAGAPMLEVLAGSGISDVLAIVTRYFGGVLLGAGGLVRAYSDAVRVTLADAGRTRRMLMRRWQVSVGHAEAGRLEHALHERGASITGVEYAVQVTINLLVRVGEVDDLQGWLAHTTGGRAVVRDRGVEWADER